MEPWSARDDAPFERRPESAAPAWMLVVLVIVAIAATGYYLWWLNESRVSYEPPPAPAVLPGSEAPAADAPEVAAVAEPVPAPRSVPLPSLDNSDPMMRDTVSGLVGRQAFETMVYPSQLVRRIVATVDNLPRETAPRRVMPLEPVPGAMAIAGAGEEMVIAPGNTARYTPFVRVFESLDARALVQRYVDSYPLFQRAYAELGFPNGNFHRRLVEAIDDMLAAPELTGPVRLVRPKVLYQFADPDLEARSAGQKIVLRMGPENASRVKAKLREIRRELLRH
jgi:hypothetical protein